MALRNKTIITKKNGSIFIPNKIIRAEYPAGNKSDSGDDDSNLKIYYVKILADEFIKGIDIVSSSSAGFIGLVYLKSYFQDSQRVFKDFISTRDKFSKCVLVHYTNFAGDVIAGRLDFISPQYDTVTSNDFKGRELIFLSLKTQYLNEIINALDKGVKYETNF